MGNPLKDQPEVETVDEDDEDLAPHLRNKPKKGESTAGNPFDFTFEKLARKILPKAVWHPRK